MSPSMNGGDPDLLELTINHDKLSDDSYSVDSPSTITISKPIETLTMTSKLPFSNFFRNEKITSPVSKADDQNLDSPTSPGQVAAKFGQMAKSQMASINHRQPRARNSEPVDDLVS